jgi:iron complex transport system ATP-binding protein
MSEALIVEGLRLGYGSRTVIADASPPPFRPGTVTALVGPNAAGKSTLLKAVAGLLPPRAGSVRLGGRDLAGLPLRERTRHIRFMPQVYGSTARLTLFELVLVARMCGDGGRPAAADMAAVSAALATTGLTALADRLAPTLSGGQQQLAALAQALARPAPVLLLDEPTSALDIRHQLEAMAVMRQVARQEGRIVIAALHDLNLAARHADAAVLLREGHVVAAGPPAEVLTSPLCGHTYGVALATGATSRGSLAIEAYLPETV